VTVSVVTAFFSRSLKQFYKDKSYESSYNYSMHPLSKPVKML